jgi:hypothetical protein
MAIQVASTPAAPLSAKTAQVTGQKKNGKNWHENKAPFRKNAGLTTYAKRAEKQKQEAEVKKMEKEMKEEKEQERQVRLDSLWICSVSHSSNMFLAEKSPSYQRQARRQGRKGTLRAFGRQDARKARGPSEAQREEEQDAQVIGRGVKFRFFFLFFSV